METRDKAAVILQNMKKAIIGKDEALEKVLICLLARGHLLIEDVPGVGKTTMVKALAKSLNLSFSRIQFTPDLTPSDIIGLTIYHKADGTFRFRKGPVFHQIILADEINRTSPKTQASLLQAMEEGAVSVEETTHSLTQPFMVLATQNPIEYQGTFPLPEAQLDRFLMRISMGYPDPKREMEMIRKHQHDRNLADLSPVAGVEDLLQMQEEVSRLYAADEIVQYIVSIVNASRSHPDLVLGASPRASIDLFKCGKALAYLRGRDYVIPDDIKEIAPPVLNHRIILSAEASIEGRDASQVVVSLVKKIYMPAVKRHEG